MTELVRYDAACKALAEAKRVDEVKDIRDKAVAMKAYARVSKNRAMEADAAEIRQRATRRIGELIKEQKQTVGLNEGGPKPKKLTGLSNNPVRPTLADAGIDKNLANEARQLASLDEDEFEDVVDKTRKAVNKASKTVVAYQNKQQTRTDKLDRLAAKALPQQMFNVAIVDPPWRTETWSDKGKDRSADNHYATMSLDEIKALGVSALMAKSAMIGLWITVPFVGVMSEILDAWEFEFKSMLTWDKEIPGTGKWFMNQTEHLVVATRGGFPAPLPGTQISSLYRERRTRHSAKPEAILEWIDSVYPDVPKIELFRRGPVRPGWSAWGNEAGPGDTS